MEENPRSYTYMMMWRSMVWWVDHYLSRLSDSGLQQYYISDSHHGLWLLGHLIASEDDLGDFLYRGPYLYPEYQDLFGMGTQANEVKKYPQPGILRRHWKLVCEKNQTIYENLIDQQLDQPYARISDFKNETFRTIEGVIKNWIHHQMYHCGNLGTLVTLASNRRK